MDLEIVKKDIHDYLIKNDWKGEYYNLYSTTTQDKEDIINFCCHLIISSENKHKEHHGKIKNNWHKNIEHYDKYFLEYIGPILRKHKIKKVKFEGDLYKSTKWTYDTIKKLIKP